VSAENSHRHVKGPRPYKQVARAQAQQRTRETLLAAATEEFYAGHWQTTSLEALAAKAGVTKQTLLRHFGSKDQLFQQALLGAGTKILEQRWGAPRGDVQGAVENLLDHYETWGERALRIGEWEREPDSLADFSQVARQVHYEWVEYAFSPQLSALREKARARCRAALIALCDVHTWWLLSHDLQLERSEVCATLTDVIERLLAQDGGALQRTHDKDASQTAHDKGAARAALAKRASQTRAT
jgi:AcrR family transcriptional regulator